MSSHTPAAIVTAESDAKAGAALSPAAALTLCTTILTLGAGAISTYLTSQATERARIEAGREKSVENARTAALMYFDKLADLRGKATLDAHEQQRFARDLNLIGMLSDNDEVKAWFRQTAIATVQAKRAETLERDPKGNLVQVSSPATTLQGLPDFSTRQADATYTATDFRAFPQAPTLKYEIAAAPLHDALAALGFNVQAVERMATGRSPKANVVRYYRAAHRAIAEQAAAALSAKLNTPFKVVQVTGGDGLPNGVIEVWIGEG